MPDDVRRFWGGDSRLGTQVGKRTGRDIQTTGKAGYLLFGPYIPLAAGQYRVAIRGVPGDNGVAGANMDVAFDQGRLILAESALGEPDVDGCLVSLPIALDAPCTDLEVRVWVGEDTDLTVSMICIEPWQGNQDSGDAPAEATATVRDSMGHEVVLAEVEVLAEHPAASNDDTAPDSQPTTSAAHNYLPPSSTQAKAKRKKRR